MKFETVTKGSEQFDAAQAAFEQIGSNTFDYDGLAAAYARLDKDDYIKFTYTKGKGGIIASQLEKRGLSRGVDFQLKSQAVSENPDETQALVMVKRLTDKAPGAVARQPRGRKPGAAAQNGADVASENAANASANASGSDGKAARPAKTK